MKIINYKTGLITEEQKDYNNLFPEPPYVKIYIDDLAALLELPIGIRGLLYELAQTINNNGILILKRTMKNEIANKLDITIGTFDNYLTKLVQAGVLKRIGRGKFEVNPNLFAPGEWNELADRPNRLETNFKMTITYLSTGQRKIEGRITE
jgi:Firmicute plasmid replication protein (RepL)